MQRDTRRLTVAREHLESAREEITRAQGQAEVSMAQASVSRALGHLDIASQRLELERQFTGRGPDARAVERAYQETRRAWQGAHDAMNQWDLYASQGLGTIGGALVAALEAVDAALGVTPVRGGE